MKSFPSTANEGKLMYNSTQSQSYKATFDIERIRALNLNSSVPVIQEMLNENNINAGNYQAQTPMHTVNLNYMLGTKKDDQIYYEDPLHLPAELIALAKDYEWVYKYQAKALLGLGEKNDKSIKSILSHTSIVPSMFNPMYGVNALGMIRNTPLLNDIEDSVLDPNIDDCSIRTLCTLSKNANSCLGNARYKYADFMYCKDLGKVSNNHLITLRKFAHPVPDHIFEGATPQFAESAGPFSWKGEGDVGRLISWFGTDDNKLEDICNFSYHASWKELTAQIEIKDNNADNPNSGIIGMISNTMNPAYNKGVNVSSVGTHSIWGWLGAKITPSVFQGIGQNNELLRNYDNNKVYEPKNTVQSNHIYEGKLEFSHEFTLNFSYQLRGYDNINPRSAFIDLIGNILEVTYRRGKFWGGSRRTIGPAQDTSMYDKTNAFVEKAFDWVGGQFSQLMNGGINFKQILGQIGSVVGGTINKIMNDAQNVIKGNEQGKEIVDKEKENMINLFKESGFTLAAKGYLKNALGRPQLFAWQSLLSGDDVGLWHVTVGNPKNPILAIGNLILTNATVTQSGPLGVDDFPSELKVSVTLKHARPRDVTEIGRMYTKGTSAIYNIMAGHDISDFWSSEGGKGNKQNESTADSEKTTSGNTTDAITQTRGNMGGTSSTNNPNVNNSQNAAVAKESAKDASTYNKRNNAQSWDNLVIPNPLFLTDDETNLMRKNTYSDSIFRLMLDETA